MRDLFDNGVSALGAFRQAITTTSHNIANVNTEGYSRQRVLLTTQPADRTTFGSLGNGVRIQGVERIASEFATSRVFDATAAQSRDATQHALASRLDNLLAEDALDVGQGLDRFFAALEDATTDPGSTTTRQAVLTGADELAGRFNALHAQIDDTAGELDARRRASVDTLNELAASVAEINRDIGRHVRGGREAQPSDLLDKREQLIVDMSEHTDLRVHEQANGAVHVSIGDGVALVSDETSHRLSVVPGDRAGRSTIHVQRGGDTLDIGGRLSGGALGGLDAFADGMLAPATAQLGVVAHQLAARVNEAHAGGVDRAGVAGGTWFTIGAPSVLAASSNAGSAVPTVTIEDADALQASDYTARFDGGAWQITRSSDAQVTSGSSPIVLDGLTFDLPGGAAAGDRFDISAVSRAAGSLTTVLSAPDALALAAPVRGETDLANGGDTRVSRLATLDPRDASLARPVTLTFTAADRYTLVDAGTGATLASDVPWQSGDAIEANGWSLTLEGSPRAGDRHDVVPNASGGNDNGNGLALAALRHHGGDSGRTALHDGAATLVGTVGSDTRALVTRSETTTSLRNEALARREAVAGVNIDEEAIDLARYEQAYQAAAQVISTADELFQTILGAVR